MMGGAKPGRGDHQGSATRLARGFGILPFVTDDKGAVQVHMPGERRLAQQANPRPAAWTTVGFVMRADENVIQWQDAAEQVMHDFQLAPRLITSGEARLVSYGQEDKTSRFQFLQVRGGLLVDVKLIQRQRPDLVSAFNPDLVEHPIPFKKHTQFHAVRLGPHRPRPFRVAGTNPNGPNATPRTRRPMPNNESCDRRNCSARRSRNRAIATG